VFRKSSLVIIPSILLNVALLCWFARIAANICMALSAVSSDSDVDFVEAYADLGLEYLDKDSIVLASTNDMCSCMVFDGGPFPFSIGCYPGQYLLDGVDGTKSKYSIRYGGAVVDWKQDSSGKCFAVRVRMSDKCWTDARGDGVWKECSDSDTDCGETVEGADDVALCNAAENGNSGGTESAGR
jgi:hypothetical protein